MTHSVEGASKWWNKPLCRLFFSSAILSLAVVALAAPAHASTNKFWVGAGGGDHKFSTAANWSLSTGGAGGAAVPGVGDIAVFDGAGAFNTAATLDATVNVDGISVTGAYTATITQSAGITVTTGAAGYVQSTAATFAGAAAAITDSGVFTLSAGIFTSTSGTLTVGGAFNTTGTGTFTHNAGTVVLNDSLTLTNTQSFKNLQISGASKTVTLGSAITVTGNLTIDATNILTTSGSSYTVGVAGTWTNAGAFTSNTGTVNLTSASSVNLTSGGSSFYNLTFNHGSTIWTLQDALVVTNDLTITAGTLDVSAAGCSTASCAVSVGGNWLNAGTFIPQTGTVTFNKAIGGTQTVNNGAAGTFYSVVHSGAGTLQLLTNPFDVDGNFSQTAGIFDAHSINQLYAGNFSLSDGTTYTKGGTVTFDGTTAAVYTDSNVTPNSTQNIGTVTINKPSGTQTLTLASDITADSITISASNTLSGAHTITTGTWVKTGTFTATGSTLVLTATGTLTNATALNNLTINASSSTVTLGANLIANGSFNLVSGTFAAATFTQSYGGNFTLAAGTTFTKGTGGGGGAVTFDGTTAAVYTDSTAGIQNIGAVTINKPSGTQTLTLATDVRADSITISAANTLAGAAHTITTGTWTNSGTFTPGTSTLVLTDNNPAFSDATHFNNFTVNGSGKTVTLAADLTVTGATTITAGALAGATYTITTGTWSKSGTFTPNTSTLVLTATGTLTNATAINNLTINAPSATVTLGSAIVVNGTLTLAAGTLDTDATNHYNISAGVWTRSTGTFTSRTNTVTLTGTGTLTDAANSFNNLTINGSSTTVTLGSAITVAGATTISAGDTLDGATFTLSTGTWANSGTFTPSTGTLTLTNTNASFSDTTHFNNLTINGSGKTVTLAAALSVAGNLTITAGTLVTTGQTQTYSGNVTIATAGHYTKGGAVLFNGTTATTYADNSTGGHDIGAVTITKTGAGTKKVTLAGDMNVDTLVISASNTLDLASYTLNIANAGATATVLTVTGTLTPTTGLVKFSATNSGGSITIPANPYYSLQLSGAQTYVPADSLISTNAIGGNVTIDSGATLDLTSSNYDLTVAGNWTNNGTFTGHSTTVTLNGSSQAITGNNSFYNLTDATAGATLTFAANSAQTVTNTLTLTGASGSRINLRSSSAGTQWAVNVTGSKSLSYVDVQDGNAVTTIDCDSTCYDSGNNLNWTFVTASSGGSGSGSSGGGGGNEPPVFSAPKLVSATSKTTSTSPIRLKLQVNKDNIKSVTITIGKIKYTLYDDGKHGDGKKGDGTYSTNLIKFLTSTLYTATAKYSEGTVSTKGTVVVNGKALPKVVAKKVVTKKAVVKKAAVKKAVTKKVVTKAVVKKAPVVKTVAKKTTTKTTVKKTTTKK